MNEHSIPGLEYRHRFLSPKQEEELLFRIDVENGHRWRTDLPRKTQHYGHPYNYNRRTVSSYIGPLPEWLSALARDLVNQGLMSQVADQAIVNEYLPGQGIAAHVDHADFGPE